MAILPADYHSDTTRISKSGLDVIANQSPLHYWYKYLSGQSEERKSKALHTGSLVHCVVLEPKELYNRYIVLPHDAPKQPTSAQIKAANPTKEAQKLIGWWSEFSLEAQGKIIIPQSDLDHSNRLRDAIMRQDTAAYLLQEGGIAEEVVVWTCPYTGAKCKLKGDWVSTDRWGVDLKTTEDASPREFGKSVAKYRYHVQGAFYSDGYEFGQGQPLEGFAFIAVEKSAPYAVSIQYLTDRDIKLGREAYLVDLQRYMKCLKSGYWEGYPDELIPVEMPSWARKKKIIQEF